MKKNGHRLLTLAALVGTAAGVIHIANRFIDATSQLKDMLEQPHSKTSDWRFGKIFYTKQGCEGDFCNSFRPSICFFCRKS